jgi:hypothetical protein
MLTSFSSFVLICGYRIETIENENSFEEIEGY